jgi:hypothetical protein
MSEEISITNLFGDSYYNPTDGSMTFSLRRIDMLVAPSPDALVNDALLRMRLDRALDDVAESSKLNVTWQGRPKVPVVQRPGSVEANYRVDSALGALHQHIESYLKLPPDNPLHQLAAQLISRMFAQGVAPFTTMIYEDQFDAVKVIVKTLRSTWPDHIAKLGLKPFVDAVEAENDDFGAKINVVEPVGITYDQVAAAHQHALGSFFAVLLAIWNNYLDEPDTRNKLLAAVHQQNERFRRYYQRRSTQPVVNPVTGEFLEDETAPGASEGTGTNAPPHPATADAEVSAT